jgi:hypothetical protein
MAGLPAVPLPRDEVVVAGERVLVRSLSRSEVVRVAEFKDNPDGAEDFILACGVGVSVDEAHAWRDTVDADVAGLVIDRICELSGLTEGAQKSSGESDSAG